MNLTLIFKKFKHQKTIALLRIISMGLGMGGALVLFYIVVSSLTTDGFYPEKDQIYQVFAQYKSPNYDSPYEASLFEPLVPAMVADFPQIKYGTVTFNNGISTFRNKQSLIDAQTLYADSSFFKVFERPFILGNPNQSLGQVNTAIITRKLARKMFGNEYDAIGKVIYLNQTRPIRITGVIKNWPNNSSFNSDIIISFATLKDENRLYMGWDGGGSFWEYVKLGKGGNPSQIDNALPGVLQKYYNVKAWAAKNIYIKYKLVPITKAFLTTDPQRKNTISIMALLGILILGLACFNSLLLILSGRQKFHKEIYIQRALGASGLDVQKLIFNETLVYMLASGVVALGFILLINPYVEAHYWINLTHAFSYPAFLLLTVLVFLISFLIIYWIPVRWVVRYFNTTHQSNHAERISMNTVLQKILLTFQIGISISLLIFLWVIQNQFNYISQFNMGYNPEQLLYIKLKNKPLYTKDKIIRAEISRLPNVLSASLSDDVPLYPLPGNGFTKTPDGNTKIFRNIHVDPNFFKTLGIKIKGQGFEKTYINKYSIVITEKVAKILDMKQPVGKFLYRNGHQLTIRGVIPNIISGSLHEEKQPIVFSRYDEADVYSVVTVRIASHQMKNTIHQIKKTIEKIVPGQIVQVNYYSSDIKSNYENDIAMKKTVSFFALFAAFITLAGLIGFTTTMIDKRTKELGIRKINGASEQSLVLLLNKTFIINLVIAILVFVPVSYHVAKIWLQNFAYAISLHSWLFVLVSILVSIVVLAVVTVFTLKAARRNPAETLRYE